MTKIYLVRYGSYSDQGIAGAFSTEEKANYFCSIRNKLFEFDDYWVDEYVLDEHEYKSNLEVNTYHVAEILVENVTAWGEEHNKGDLTISAEDNITENLLSSEPVVIEKHVSDDNEYKTITVYCQESAKKAEKIAIEQYQIYTQQQLESGEL